MNIFSNLAKLMPGHQSDERELTEDEVAAQEKTERVKFHREQVRNGPVKFRSVSAGQIRRARQRAMDRDIRRNYRREVRNHFERQRVAATLRPHLQAVGLAPTWDDRDFPLEDQIISTAWIAQRYGRETTVDGVGTGHVSFLREDIIAALETAASFYRAATGDEIVKLPADYEPAIYVDESQVSA